MHVQNCNCKQKKCHFQIPIQRGLNYAIPIPIHIILVSQTDLYTSQNIANILEFELKQFAESVSMITMGTRIELKMGTINHLSSIITHYIQVASSYQSRPGKVTK